MAEPKYLNTKAGKKKAAVKSLDAIARLFMGACGNARRFAPIVGCKTQNTAAKRLSNPKDFSLEEIITASVALGFSGSISLQNGETRVEVQW